MKNQKMAGQGREQPTTPTNQNSFPPGVPQTANSANGVSQIMVEDSAAKGLTAQPEVSNLGASKVKSTEAMQVDYQTSNAPASATGAEQITGVVPSQAPMSAKPPVQTLTEAPQPANSNMAAETAQPAQTFTNTMEAHGKERRASGLKKMELTAQNLEVHQQQLIQQDSGTANNAINGGQRVVQASGSGNGQQPTAATIPAIQTQANSAATNPGNIAPKAAQPKDGGPQPSITLSVPTSNPGPGRPAGSTTAQRNQKKAAAAAAATAHQQQQQQQQQQQYAAAGQQPHPQVAPPNAAQVSADPQVAAAMAAKQQQIIAAQAQQHNMTPEQFLKYQQHQYMQKQQAQQNSTGAMQAPGGGVQQAAAHASQQQKQMAIQASAGVVDPNQLRQQLHHQQSFTHSQSSHVHPGHSSQAAAVYQQQHPHAAQHNNGKLIASTVISRIQQCFKDNSLLLHGADKQHADSLAKQIKKEELQFFLKTDDTRYNKQSLLDQKNQRMDEYISFCAENGGRVIPKQEEPIGPPHEAPIVVEARMLHMDFVEEAYWKRVQASRIAQECRIVALRKAQERATRKREESQRLQQIEEQEKKDEDLKAQNETAQNAAPAIDTGNAGQEGGQVGAATSSMMIDTTPKVGDQGPSGMLDDLIGGNAFDALDGPGFDPLDAGFGDMGMGDMGMDDMGLGDMGLGGDMDGGGDLLGNGLDFGLDNDLGLDQQNFGDMGLGQDQMDIVNEYADDGMIEDDFDPEKMILQQEERLEQQRIEESKKQEEEKLQKIAQIEQEAIQAEVSHHSEPISRTERVQTTLFDDTEIDPDKYDQLAALEAEILALDLTYLKPAQDVHERQFIDGKVPNHNEYRDGKIEDQEIAQEEVNSSQYASQHKNINYIESAKSAIKQKFDRLGQLIIDKGYNASELIHTDQFNQVLNSYQEEGEKAAAKEDLNYDSLQDKLSTLLQGDQEMGIYVMPGMEDFEFDSDQEAIDLDECEDEEVMDMDGFFTEVGHHDIKKGSSKNAAAKTGSKIRAPTVYGDEQRKMYEEMREINELAPERNDQNHMEHLCKFWIEREQEEIQDKKYIKEYFDDRLRHADEQERSEHKMDRKQKQTLQSNIESYRQNIEQRLRNLDKYKKPEYQPKELHRERFLLIGSDHPQLHQSGLAPQEFSFIKWYYGLFPDQWRLIADIINYHPLTRGPLHCKEYMAREYFNRLDSNHRDLLLSRQKIQMQPWRETKLPWLVNGREGCLMNSMTYLNKSHLQSIHKVTRMTQRPKQTKQVFKFTINAQGCLQLERVDAAQQDLVKPVVVEQTPDEKADLAGVKRTRADIEIDTDEESLEDLHDNQMIVADGRHYSDTQIQERLLNQMLARRRRNEDEENEAIESGKYVRPDIYIDRPFLKELMMDIVHKRRRSDEQTSQQVVPKFIAFAYDPVKTEKDELDKNTPMWYALQHMNSCQTTIRVQHSTMFWLGYFIRRIMHEENLDKNREFNFDRLKLWESNSEIKNYFINQAKKVRLEQEQIGAAGQASDQQALFAAALLEKEKQEQEHLTKEIKHFMSAAASSTTQLTAHVEVKEVNDLWEGKSPYYYDKEQKHEYIKQEKDCDQRISNVMYQKSKQLWDELQFYWFQVNKNLHPRYRKDQVNMMSSSEQQQHQQALAAQQQQQRNNVAAVSTTDPSGMHQPAANMQSMGPNNSVLMTQRPPQAQGQMNVSGSQTMGQINVSASQYPMAVNPNASMTAQSQMPNVSMISSTAQPNAAQFAAQQSRMPPTGQPIAAPVNSNQRRQQYQHPQSSQQQQQNTNAGNYLIGQGSLSQQSQDMVIMGQRGNVVAGQQPAPGGPPSNTAAIQQQQQPTTGQPGSSKPPQ